MSDADAQTQVLASNRGAVWYRWAEANGQPALLSRLGLLSLIPAAELQALDANGTVAQPNCAIFPTKVVVFPVGPDAMRFFSSLGQHVSDRVALVASFAGPCEIIATTATGVEQTIASYSGSGVTFFAGELRNDPLLGRVWYTDGAGNCDERGAPTSWCT